MKKKWKDISVTKKIFLMILLSMIVILSLFMVIQGFLYGKIYSYTKHIALEESLTAFSKEYSQLTDKDEINKKITEYSAKNNAYIMVVDNHGIKYAVSYEMQIETSSGEKMRFSLDGALRSREFTDLEIKENDEVKITFMRFDRGKSDLYIPESISNKNGEWKNNSNVSKFFRPYNEEAQQRPWNSPDTITGRVTSIIIPTFVP